MAKIDPTSDAIVFVHDGSERGAAGAPARDLTENDIARLAYRRSVAAVTDDVGRPIDPDDPEAGVIERPDPRKPDPEVVDEILAELEASGRYARPERKKASAKKSSETPTPESAAPAEKQPEA